MDDSPGPALPTTAWARPSVAWGVIGGVFLLYFSGEILTGAFCCYSDLLVALLPKVVDLYGSASFVDRYRWSNVLLFGYSYGRSAGATDVLHFPDVCFFATCSAPTAFILIWMFHFALGLVFMYRFMRQHRVSREAAALAALCFVFCAAVTRRVLHVPLIEVVLSTPLVFWLAERLVQKQQVGTAIVLGLVGANCTIAGHPQFVAYLWPVAFAYAVWRTRERAVAERSWRRLVAGWAMATVILLGGAALFWVPLLTEIHATLLTEKLGGTVSRVNPLEAVIMLFAPLAIGADLAHSGGPSRHIESWEWSIYIGIIPLLFLPIAFARSARARHPVAGFFGGLVALSLLFLVSDWPSPAWGFARIVE